QETRGLLGEPAGDADALFVTETLAERHQDDLGALGGASRRRSFAPSYSLEELRGAEVGVVLGVFDVHGELVGNGLREEPSLVVRQALAQDRERDLERTSCARFVRQAMVGEPAEERIHRNSR